MALKIFFHLLIFFPFVQLHLYSSEESALRRLSDHMLLKDYHSAINEGKKFIEEYPNSVELHIAYIKALCEIGDEQNAFSQWKKISFDLNVKDNHQMIFESLAWGVLTKGEGSSLLMIRLYSLLAAAFTQDARAVPVLLREMKSSNAYLRSLAVKIAASYGDDPLQKQLLHMLKEEKVWYVRLEVIQAIGRLRVTKALPILKDIISNSKTLVEEKAHALLAISSMYSILEEGELLTLVLSDRAGLRELACELVSQFDKKEYLRCILPLLNDPSPNVRVACLNSIGLLGKPDIENVPVIELIKKQLNDVSPEVAITAAWVATIFDYEEGKKILEKWIVQDVEIWKRMASAALAACGSHGVDLSVKLLKDQNNIFVKANLAIGLIGLRKDVQKSSKVLFEVLHKYGNELWMWDNQMNPLFRSLAPSNVKHVDQVPRYPYVVDQHVKLDLLSILSIVGHPKALDLVKGFLKEQSWGVTSSAASMLLQEGDEQSLELVRKLLDDPEEKIRIQAALILAMIGGDTKAIKTLQDAYHTVDRDMKMYIIEAIGHIGDQSSIPFLVNVLNEPFQVMRVIAASALIKCLYH